MVGFCRFSGKRGSPEAKHKDQVRGTSDLPFVRLAAALDAGVILVTSNEQLRWASPSQFDVHLGLP